MRDHEIETTWSETWMESDRMLPQQSLMKKLDFSLPQYRISFESPWIVYFFSTWSKQRQEISK